MCALACVVRLPASRFPRDQAMRRLNGNSKFRKKMRVNQDNKNHKERTRAKELKNGLYWKDVNYN